MGFYMESFLFLRYPFFLFVFIHDSLYKCVTVHITVNERALMITYIIHLNYRQEHSTCITEMYFLQNVI